MGKKSLIGITILIIIAILLVYSNIVTNRLRCKMSGKLAHDALAKSTLRTLATASEVYAGEEENTGRYPTSIEELTEAEPPYLSQPHCGTTHKGFRYSCQFDTLGYKFTATPVEIGKTGNKIYTITTGRLLGTEP